MKLKTLFLKILNNPKYFWSLVVVVYIVSRVGTWVYPFDSDHWIFYYVGKIWAQGGTLYVNAWDHKPPLIFAANGLMYLFFGGNLVLHRVWLTLLSLVDIVLFWKLAKMVLPDLLKRVQVSTVEIATKVALLFYVLWRNLSQFTSSGNNTENLGLIFFIGMILSYLSFRKDQKWWKMLLSGVCFSMLFFLKGNFLLLGVPLGILLLIDNWKSIRKFFGYGIIFVIPLALQAAFWAAYFTSKGAFADFWLASFQFSAKYSTSAWSGGLSNMSTFYILLAMASPIVILGPVLFVLDLWNHRTKEYLFWSLLVVFGSVAFFAVGVPYLYYFEIMMPVYALAATVLLFRESRKPAFIYYGYVLALSFAVLLNFVFSTYQIKNTLTGRVQIEASEYSQIADYVREHTAPTDKVFAYDYGATFYRLAERDSGSRFVSASVLLLENRDNYGFHFDDLFIREMEQLQTKYVVVYTDRSTLYYDNKPIVEYFDSHYSPEKSIGKFSILKRNN